MKNAIESDLSEIVNPAEAEKSAEIALVEQYRQEFALAKDKAQIEIANLIILQCQRLCEYLEINTCDTGYVDTLVTISQSIVNLVDSLQKLGLQNQSAEEKIDTKRITEIVKKEINDLFISVPKIF